MNERVLCDEVFKRKKMHRKYKLGLWKWEKKNAYNFPNFQSGPPFFYFNRTLRIFDQFFLRFSCTSIEKDLSKNK